MKFLILLSTLLSFSLYAKDNVKITLDSTNVVVMNDVFTFESVSKVQQEILEKANVPNPPQEIFLFLSTPGGSVTAGKILIDTLNALPVKVSTITSFSASMGYSTVQGLTKGTRYILPSGTLMSHRASVGGIGGQVPGEADSRLKMIKDSVDSLEKVAAKRVGISLEQYKKLILNEYWVHGEDAVKANHADQVADVTCSKDLIGTKVESLNFMGFPLKVTFSKCPLVQGPLAIEVENSEYMGPELLNDILTKYSNSLDLKNNIVVTP